MFISLKGQFRRRHVDVKRFITFSKNRKPMINVALNAIVFAMNAIELFPEDKRILVSHVCLEILSPNYV